VSESIFLDLLNQLLEIHQSDSYKDYKVAVATKEDKDVVYKCLFEELYGLPKKRYSVNCVQRIKKIKGTAKSLYIPIEGRYTYCLFKKDCLVGYVILRKEEGKIINMIRMYIFKKYRYSRATAVMSYFITAIQHPDNIFMSESDQMPGFKKRIKHIAPQLSTLVVLDTDKIREDSKRILGVK
jgi:hypothetical protein